MFRRILALRMDFAAEAGCSPTRVVLSFDDADQFAKESNLYGDRFFGMAIEVRDVAATYVAGEPRIEVERVHRQRARA